MMKRVMCIWFPHWPLQETLVRRPEWKDHPVVLYTKGGRGGWTVVNRSRKANAAGVQAGMPLAQAKAILDSATPPAKYEELDPAVCFAALHAVAIRCLRFSPVVGMEEKEEKLPQCLFLDIAGCDHLFGGEEAMARAVRNFLAEQNLVARVAIADTIGAAWAIVHYSKNPLCIIPVGEHAKALKPLPLEALRIDPLTSFRLRQLDITTIGRLQTLPRKTLPSRFGVELVHRLDQALGHVPELVPRIGPPLYVESVQHLECPTMDRFMLENTIRLLVQRLVEVAEQANRGIQQVNCHLTAAQQQEVCLCVRLVQPTVSVDRLLDLIRLRLEATELPAEVERLRIEAEIASVEVQCWSLFGDAGQHERRRDLMSLIERLSSRLGSRAIVRPQWSKNPQPEFAVAYAPALQTETSPKAKRPSREPPPMPVPRIARFRPTSLIEEPAQVDVLAIVPDGPPIRFYWQSQTYTVARWWGPERIETGWWHRQHERRDYYRVETGCGRRFWLFRCLTDGRWFLHGMFA